MWSTTDYISLILVAALSAFLYFLIMRRRKRSKQTISDNTPVYKKISAVVFSISSSLVCYFSLSFLSIQAYRKIIDAKLLGSSEYVAIGIAGLFLACILLFVSSKLWVRWSKGFSHTCIALGFVISLQPVLQFKNPGAITIAELIKINFSSFVMGTTGLLLILIGSSLGIWQYMRDRSNASESQAVNSQ